MSQNKQDKGFRFSIRKRSVGVCGVAIATFLLGSGRFCCKVLNLLSNKVE